ncbi:MAG: multiple sugar transport system substrate-binding protein, partial [Pseudonocardiales bacterium]|nr:multiple sugar transport system substrate-binding protein [Pseudonocardiales bacterium]
MLAGCSGSGGTSNSGGEITLQEIDDYIPTSPQGIAIDWLFTEYHNTHPNVTIKKTGIPANELQKLQAQATTNSLPDIAMIDNPNYPVLAATNKLRSIPLESWGLQNAYIKGAQEVV